ncbi:hypothetical protein AB0B25_24525 [Nocardia sp. NPDC049190]
MALSKGRRLHPLPFSDKSRSALRRYLRARASHRAAVDEDPALWLAGKAA